MVKAPPVALVKFLLADGHELHPAPGAGKNEQVLNCFNPNHRGDEQLSMRVDLHTGTYKCDACGSHGNAVSYLRRARGLPNAQAFALLKETGWTQARIDHADREDKLATVGGLQWLAKIPEVITKGNLKRRAEFPYGAGDYVAQYRVLYSAPLGSRRSRREHYEVFCEAASRGGGFWRCDCIDAAMPAEDRLVQQYPLYRVADMQRRLEGGGHDGAWIVSDERVCEMVRGVTDHPRGPIPVTCLYNLLRTRLEEHDIEPLVGKKVLLVAAQDEPGRRLMRRLGWELGKLGVDCTYCLLAGNTGTTIGDVIGQSGLEGLRAWLSKAHIGDDPQPPPDAAPDDPAEKGLENNAHFTILGLVEGKLAVRVKRTHELAFVSRSMLMSETTLLPLAPADWWLALAGARNELSRGDRVRIADKLNRVAEGKGFYDLMASAIGRGAFPYAEGDKTRVGYNLGNRVLIAGEDKKLTEEVGLDAIDATLLPGAPVQMYDDPQAVKYGRTLVNALADYRWQTDEHAKAYIGWIVTALLGGALRFRPALWITASPSAGKSFLIERLADIFGPVAANFNNVSQAGVANTLRSDSLPCLVDEFEPKKGDEEKWQRVLAFLRQTTSGSGLMARGTVEGMVRATRPRCSLIFASVKVPPLDAAESQRVMFLRFGREVRDWPAVEDAILEAVAPTKMLALRTHIIRNAVGILARAREIERNLLRRRKTGLKTREAQILAGLTAGYGFLSGDYSLIRRTEEVSDDSYNALEALLAQRVHTSWDAHLTIAELLTGAPTANAALWASEAAGYGFKLLPDGALAVAHKTSVTSRLLAGTAHANTDLALYLAGIGAKVWRRPNGSTARLNAKSNRFVCRRVPREILDEIGFGPGGDGDD